MKKTHFVLQFPFANIDEFILRDTVCHLPVCYNDQA